MISTRATIPLLRNDFIPKKMAPKMRLASWRSLSLVCRPLQRGKLRQRMPREPPMLPRMPAAVTWIFLALETRAAQIKGGGLERTLTLPLTSNVPLPKTSALLHLDKTYCGYQRLPKEGARVEVNQASGSRASTVYPPLRRRLGSGVPHDGK
jgi:hypothetical protein